MSPQLASIHIEDGNLNLNLSAREVVVDDEGSLRRGGIVGATDALDGRFQSFDDLEVEHGGGSIIQHIPRTEAQLMRALGEFRQRIPGRTAGISAEVEREVLIEVESQVRVSIDAKLQVVPHTAARGVDAILVRDVGHEIGRGIDASPIDKRGCIEVAVDRRSNTVVAHRLRTIDEEAVLGTMGQLRMVVADSIDIDESATTGVVDIERDELIPVEVKSNNDRSKSLATLIKNENYSDIKRGIKLGDFNIGYANNIYTFPYFCAFMIKAYLKSLD